MGETSSPVFRGQALDIYRDEALVGKDHRVAHAFKAEVDGLTVNEDGRQFCGNRSRVTRSESRQKTATLKVDHSSKRSGDDSVPEGTCE